MLGGFRPPPPENRLAGLDFHGKALAFRGTSSALLARMRARRAFVIGAIMAVVLAGLPLPATAATPCRSCCPEMAACCELAPVPPATPVQSDRQVLTPQPATAPLVQGVPRAASFNPLPGPPVGSRHTRRLRNVVLRI